MDHTQKTHTYTKILKPCGWISCQYSLPNRHYHGSTHNPKWLPLQCLNGLLQTNLNSAFKVTSVSHSCWLDYREDFHFTSEEFNGCIWVYLIITRPLVFLNDPVDLKVAVPAHRTSPVNTSFHLRLAGLRHGCSVLSQPWWSRGGKS